MFAKAKLAAIVLVPFFAAMACDKGHGVEANPTAAANEGSRDFVRYEPGSAPLGFIKIETVVESEAGTSASLPGRVSFDEDHTQRVASPIDGRATAVLVKIGDQVRVGQALISLSSPNVGQLQADAQKADSDLTVAQKGIERAHKLQAEGAVSDKDVAQAEADFRKATTDRARTGAQLKALGISATDPSIEVSLRAQVAGIVVDRNVLLGQEVRADQATPLMTISSLDTLWVLADVYEQDLGLVENGAPVTVHVPAYPADSFPGRISNIGEVVDTSTRTVKVRCVVDNPGHRLKPEMFARVNVQSKPGHKVILAPSKAILNDGERFFVIVASEGITFRIRRVTVGPDLDGQSRILSGLTPGEKIVTDGAIFMRREIESQ
ncbi:MAG TPA: efflux RND transporter periplasmic adaptor subunit [Polyangia bacterium]